MKTGLKVFLGFLVVVVLVFGLDLMTGYMGVFKTKTVGKAQQNADREVFEETQSFVEAKRQSALKWYREYTKAETLAKKGIVEMVAHEFANFKEEKYLEGKVLTFIKNCKYDPQSLIPSTPTTFPLKE